MSDAQEAKELRSRLVFTIVPCLNPDGVIMGNYRTGFSGHDLNRQFAKPDYRLHPTVAAVKQLIGKIASSGNLLACLDLHAHSRKKSVFIYGPYYPLHSDKYYSMRILPKLICDQGPQFRFPACRFRNEASKRQAARLVIWKELKLANSYTVESSLYGYLTEDRRTVPFTENAVLDVGKGIVKGLFQYVMLLEEEEKLKEEKSKQRQLRRIKPKAIIAISALDEVVNSIKSAQQEADTSLSSSSDDSDELDSEDQTRLHGAIVTVMEEFSSLAGPRARRPATREIRLRVKTRNGRLTPEQNSERLNRGKAIYRSGGFRVSHRTRTPAAGQERLNVVIPLPRMAEYHASRSVSACRQKRAVYPSPSKLNIHKYALETRRLIAKLKSENSYEETSSFRRDSPMTPAQPSLFLEDSEGLVDSTSLTTMKSQVTRLSPAKRPALAFPSPSAMSHVRTLTGKSAQVLHAS